MITLLRKMRLQALAMILAACFVFQPANCLAFEDNGELRTVEKQDRVQIFCGKQLITEFVFRDPQILRPYFSNVNTPSGIKVTRNHPPIDGQDQLDHATMHPGIWLGFGDINGQDFWRNKAKVEHEKFTLPPTVREGTLDFATRSSLVSSDGKQIGFQGNYFQICKVKSGIRIVWICEFWGLNPAESNNGPMMFGDQEEMGFGVRVTTAITEKNGGRILSATGAQTAKNTWGQAASWCDYSGKLNDRDIGLTVFCESSPEKPTWWHNRDYGLMVANSFGRAAMKQGAAKSTAVQVGDTLVLRYGVIIHEGNDYSPVDEYNAYTEQLKSLPPSTNPMNRWK